MRLVVTLALGLFLAACGPAPDPITPVVKPPAQAKEEPKETVEVVLTEAIDGSPQAARRYRRDVISEGRAVWGMDAPIPMFGGQIQQESGWNPQAVSPVGAAGMAQFMPATGEWITNQYPELGPHRPFNPAWAIRAMVRYDRYIYEQTAGATDCDRLAFTLSGYNGGPGWVKRDQRKAMSLGLDEMRYWGSVERVNAGRSAANWAENRGYPRRILLHHQPKYEAWGGKYHCKEIQR